LAAAAAAGVSVAFGSPLGGVLFGLEGTLICLPRRFRGAYFCFAELDAIGGDFDVLWRGFVTSVIAAVALQYVDPFRTSKLVLFQVCSVLFLFCRRGDSLHAQVTNGSDTWLAFELVCTLPDFLQCQVSCHVDSMAVSCCDWGTPILQPLPVRRRSE